MRIHIHRALMSSACFFAFLGLAAGQPPPAGHVAELTDTSGAVSRLTYLAGANTQEFNGSRGYATGAGKIPVALADGLYLFLDLDRIREYRLSTDGKVVVDLASGDQVSGAPCGDCKLEGEGTLGKITITAQKIRSIKVVDVEKAAKVVEGGFVYVEERKDDGRRLRVTTRSGATYAIWLDRIAFPYRHNYCDTHWIPCKPTSEWNNGSKLPIKYGESDAELDFKLVKSIGFGPRAATADRMALSANLQTGETVTATVAARDALVAYVDYGRIYIPLSAVQSIEGAVGK